MTFTSEKTAKLGLRLALSPSTTRPPREDPPSGGFHKGRSWEQVRLSEIRCHGVDRVHGAPFVIL